MLNHVVGLGSMATGPSRRSAGTLILVCVLMAASAADEPPEIQLTDLEWIPSGDPRFEVNGLPFYRENEGRLWRLPARAEGTVPTAVWNLARCPSGGRIRFRSNTEALAIRLTYPSLPGMRNMHAFGQAGVDAYVDGEYLASVAPRGATEVEAFFFRDLESRYREITLYLPLYLGVTVHAIGLVPGSEILPPAPFAIPDPVVFYGTSITQGGCASRPGNSYQAILARSLNLDFVNFGFSGSGKGEPEVARLIAEVTASCFVMDMAQNSPSVEALEAVYLPFIRILRERHPVKPIICITPIYSTTELPGSAVEKNYPAMRDVIRRAVAALSAGGDMNLYLVEGYSLLGPSDGDGLVDGAHPNDLGFQRIADRLEPLIRVTLKL